jgi:hypothetical protein
VGSVGGCVGGGVRVLMRRYFPVGLKTEASAGMYCLRKTPGEWTRKCDTAEGILTSDEIYP